jgi:molybdopterin synthase sulfur carrier subunit
LRFGKVPEQALHLIDRFHDGSTVRNVAPRLVAQALSFLGHLEALLRYTEQAGGNEEPHRVFDLVLHGHGVIDGVRNADHVRKVPSRLSTARDAPLSSRRGTHMFEPIRRSVRLERTQDDAFRLFTEHIGEWWPTERFSRTADGEFGDGVELERVVFEPQQGGRVYEITSDGREASWAEVLVYEPPAGSCSRGSRTTSIDRRGRLRCGSSPMPMAPESIWSTGAGSGWETSRPRPGRAIAMGGDFRWSASPRPPDKLRPMAIVRLRAPLKDLAGGNREITIDGASVGEVLRELERQHPRITGWVLDEHGRVRRHVNVFVGGERVREDARLAPGATLHVLPSISGGSR